MAKSSSDSESADSSGRVIEFGGGYTLQRQYRTNERSMDAQEAFLKQEVESASPAKLRFLLLQKAHGLTVVVQDLWKSEQYATADQWVLRVQDIITELLAGVVDPKHELAQVTTDLYIFMAKLIAAVAIERDVEALQNVSEILEIEMETWAMFVRKEAMEVGGRMAPAPHFASSYEDSPSFSFQA